MSRFQNLAEIIVDMAQRSPDQVALIEKDQAMTYQTLSKQIQSLAKGFELLGIKPGQQIALLLYNTSGFVLSYFALLGLGVTVVPINTRLTADEIDLILEDAQASWLVSSDDFTKTLGQINGQSLKGLILDTEEPLTQERKGQFFQFNNLYSLTVLMDQPVDTKFDFPKSIGPQTLATLIYTSGTTGKPKGVMLSHQNILADALGNVEVIQATANDSFITASPLFHVFGQTNVLVSVLLVGGCLVLVKKFNPHKILKAIEKNRVTFIAAVPTMYQMMLSCLDERSYSLASIRVCHSGAAPMPVEVFHQVEKVFGAPVQEGYGLSEASSIVTSNPIEGIRKPGSVGLPIPEVIVSVFNHEGIAVPVGEIGEIHVQGKTVMQGYWKNLKATEKVLKGNWLKTGDMGYLDEDGYLYIVDRLDDVMNVGGVKIYPREIEEILYRHPAIESLVVVGRPSSLYYEKIQAFVQLKPGETCLKQDVQKFCRNHLAEYKVPKHVEFIDKIPKGATGKILRKELRLKLKAEVAID